MTPERLAEIRAASVAGSADWTDPITDARCLLAEVDRLQCDLAFARVERDEWREADARSVELGARYRERALAAEAEVDRLWAQVSDSHHPVDPTHGRGGKTICACGNLSWPCPALASGDQVQP